MKSKICLFMIVLAVAFGTTVVPYGTSGAKEWKDIDFPDQIQLDSTTLVLNGLGLRQATALK